MSVWFTESFRGQALWDFRKSTNLGTDVWMDFCRKCDIYFAGGTLESTHALDEVIYPSGECCDIDSMAREKRQELLRIFNVHKSPGKSGSISKLLVQSASRFYCGINSVYKLFVSLSKSEAIVLKSHTQSRTNWIKTFITQSLISTAYSSRSQPHILEEVCKRVDWKRLRHAEKWLLYASAARNMITMRWYGKALKAATGLIAPRNLVDTGTLDVPADWIVHTDGWMTYVQTPELSDTEWFAMTSVDLDRLQQMCVSMAMLELHQATYNMTAGNEEALANYITLRRNVESVLIEALTKCDTKVAQGICRDMKKGFGIYLSMAAGQLSDGGTAELLEEARVKGYLKSYNYQKYMTALTNAPLDVAQDLGRIFKILPAPDYDIGESFCARQQELLHPNPIVPTGDVQEASMEEFRRYQRRFMILALMRINGNKAVGKLKADNQARPIWHDDYFIKNLIPAGLHWVDRIDLTNTMRYVERLADSAVSYKDTAASEEDLREAMDSEPTHPYKRNMLMRYLFDEQCPTPESARLKLSRSVHVHRAGFKMEAHKTESRIFYIGNMSDRLVQSEMEENVHRIGKDTPGYMIGQNTEYTVKKIMSMVAPSIQHDDRIFFLNFDLKRWSPGMRSDVQRQTHELFGEVFDRPEFFEAHRINEGAHVILNKRGYTGSFINPGANFEGYNGKEMTWMHCSMMGYAVYRYKQKFRHDISIDLCAFIDDGLATFRDKVENGTQRFIHFVDTVTKTYAALGFVLELSKCYLSDCLAIFLNEIYFKGRHVTYGLRAVMRIGTNIPEATDTILDEISARSAGCQGAMKSGMDLISAYLVFLWSSSQVLLKHNIHVNMDGRAAALFFYAPKVFYGLQQPNLIAMSSNLSTDGLTESISTIQNMAKAYPPYRSCVVKMLRSTVAAKSDESTLIAPRTVKSVGVSIVETRLKRAVLLKLTRVQLASRARKLIGLGKGFDIAAFSRAVVAPNVVLVESLLNDIRESTPYSIVMALVNKFESARTIQLLIGIGTTKRIARENKTDVAKTLHAFKVLVR